jgi:purine nucleoside phosphorylase
MENKAVVLMSGRSHFYEGYSIERITYPVRVFQRLGTQAIIITNAAGGKFLKAAGHSFLATFPFFQMPVH